MSDLKTVLWGWCNEVIGRPYELQTWDCFQLLLEGQSVAGWHRAFEPVYRDGEEVDPGRTMVRNFARGFKQFKQVETPQLGAAVLFREDRVPIHVGLWMGPNLMVHTNVHTATTLAEFGPGTDYHFCLDGFYVPI